MSFEEAIEAEEIISFVTPAYSEEATIGVAKDITIETPLAVSEMDKLELFIDEILVATTSSSNQLTLSWTPEYVGMSNLVARVTDADGRRYQTNIYADVDSNATPTLGVNGATLWLRADYGLNLDSNGCVESWEDLSGNGNDAEQTDSTRRPKPYNSTFGCMPSVYFTTTQQSLIGDGGIPTGSYTKVVRYQVRYNNNWNNLLSSAENSANAHRLYHRGTYPTMVHGSDFVTSSEFATPYMDTVLIATYDASNNEGNLYTNGVLTGTGTAAGDNDVSSYQIGAYRSTQFGRFYVSEVIVYPHVLSASERDDIQNYFSEQCMTPLEVWQNETGTTDTSLDIDGDGIGRELEYALGLDPYSPDESPFDLGLNAPNTPNAPNAPNASTINIPTFDYTRPATLNHIQYDTEMSADLVNWTVVPEPPATASSIPGYEDVTVPIIYILPEGPARFGRLKVDFSAQ